MYAYKEISCTEKKKKKKNNTIYATLLQLAGYRCDQIILYRDYTNVLCVGNLALLSSKEAIGQADPTSSRRRRARV